MALADLQGAWDAAVAGYERGIRTLWSSPSNWLDAPSLNLRYSARRDQLAAQWEAARTRQAGMVAVDGLSALAAEMGVIVNPALGRQQLSEGAAAAGAAVSDLAKDSTSTVAIVVGVGIVLLLILRR